MTGGTVRLVRREEIRSGLVAVAVAALSVQVTLAAPVHLTTQLRAAACCAAGCSPAMARGCDCCHLTQGADGLRALLPASSLGQSTVTLVMTPVPILAPTGVPGLFHASEPACHGPPLFLALRSLRR